MVWLALLAMGLAVSINRVAFRNPGPWFSSSIDCPGGLLIHTAASSDTSVGARYDAFAIRNYEQENEPRAEWSKIGVAFPHRDGQAFGCC